ncbi:MAG: hypothetical protein JNJ73_17735 [Hyphomonadaceae bacterium]|nr:hypothetical protein [Hyphomonadaceae bacterium]
MARTVSDGADWAAGLDPIARARADAAADRPHADAAEPSAFERELAAASRRERARLEDAREAARAEAERMVRRLSPAAPDLVGPLAEARLEFSRVEGRAGPELAAALARATRTSGDLDGFRRANGLRREALYPDSTLLQAGLLLLAALFESVFSAALFAQEAEQGLLGGAAVAVGLSGANVTLGFLAGYLGLRYLQPARLVPRIGGAIAFGAFLALAIGLNLFAARWRETLSALSDSDARDYLTPSLDLFGFSEPQAVVLLMLGAGVWVFAALKGYSGFDDPYPDYGKMHRAHRDAEAEAASLRNDVREALEAAAETARGAIDARLGDMREALTAMRSAYDSAALDIGALDARMRRLEEEAATLARQYRQANIAARAAPPPAYFEDSLAAAAAPGDALATCGADLHAAQGALEAAQANAAQALAALGAELDQASRRLAKATE